MSGTAVIFDMDGTLTVPQFDFDAIRRDIGLDREPILEAIARMDGAQRARAERILNGYEERFAATSVLQPGARAAVTAVRNAGGRTALMTRNSRASVATFTARHGLEFDMLWCREDGPLKPSPEPVLRICRAFRCTPASAWVVGDYLYDVQCGRAAGVRTVLLIPAGERPAWADLADHVIHTLEALPELLGLRAERHPVSGALAPDGQR